MDLDREIGRRRTIAIIAHPDAGKTTLTEKLLLFAGAIHIAGSVKGRKATRHATSDWMQIEQQRGISVASSVMQFEYGGCVINLLDTPGHQDFSEDTYRVLTAVDAAVMVIDAANGVESQTLKLLEVCRSRNTPVITFINKFDREVREPMDLLDDVERTLGLDAVPFSWPIGMGKQFAGVYDLRSDCIRLFRPGAHTLGHMLGAAIELVERPEPGWGRRFGAAGEAAELDVDLVKAATADFNMEAFLEGRLSPVFFGSAVNNFGVKEVLDALSLLVPPPGARPTATRTVKPEEPHFTGVVFKVQANMDPAHRDRVAFIRVCSGRFERGKRLHVVRTGKELRTNNVVAFLSQRRDVVDSAYPGDIVGIPNHGTLRLGDTLTEGESLSFVGLPFFAPELFKTVSVTDPLRAKQLKLALVQLGEEGAIQVIQPLSGGPLMVGAVGTLQFEVVEHRLKHEYHVDARLEPADFTVARWVDGDDPAELRRFTLGNSHRLAQDASGALMLLSTHATELRTVQARWPLLRFHRMREQFDARRNPEVRFVAA